MSGDRALLVEILETARRNYLRTEEIYRTDRRFAEFKDRDFWSAENMSIMKGIISTASNAHEVVERILASPLYAVNSDGLSEERAVDWLLASFRRFGTDIITLDETLQDTPFGTPLHKVSRSGRVYTPDFLRKVGVGLRIASTINPARKPLRVLEIGGGCGALARVLQLLFPGSAHLIVDLPESLFFAECFLRANFPDKKLHYVHDAMEIDIALVENIDFVLIPTAFIKCIRKLSFDLFINMDSFGEMPTETMEHYFHLLQNDWDVRYVFLLNRFLTTVSPDRRTRRERPNGCSWQLDSSWEILHWEVEPHYTASPYVSTVIARCLEVVGCRMDRVNVEEARRLSESLLAEVREEDWAKARFRAPEEAYRDNILRVDVSREGTLFKLWDSIRLNPAAENVYLALGYLKTLLRRSDREFLDAYHLEERLLHLEPARLASLRNDDRAETLKRLVKGVARNTGILPFARRVHQGLIAGRRA